MFLQTIQLLFILMVVNIDQSEGRIGPSMAAIEPNSAYESSGYGNKQPDLKFAKLKSEDGYYKKPPILSSLNPIPEQEQFWIQDIVLNQPIYSNFHGEVDNTKLGLQLRNRMGAVLNVNRLYYTSRYGYVPKYAFVHHGYKHEALLPDKIQIETDLLGKCDNLSDFCVPNTVALCLRNGTIFCIAYAENVVPCKVDSTSKPCVKALLNTTTFIPCISTINIHLNAFLAYLTPKISLFLLESEDEVLNRGYQNTTSLTWETIVNVARTNTKFCATIIAEPHPISRKMTNLEFMEELENISALKDFVKSKYDDVVQQVLTMLFS